MIDEITLIDRAFTRPRTSVRKATRERSPVWSSEVCPADNSHVRIGKEDYYLSADGRLMPTRKDQRPPDLEYFAPGK